MLCSAPNRHERLNKKVGRHIASPDSIRVLLFSYGAKLVIEPLYPVTFNRPLSGLDALRWSDKG